MFPKDLQALIDESTPKLNPKIANGLAVDHLKHVESYVDSVFRVAADGFPPGLTYDGCSRCSPSKEYEIVTRKRGSDCVFDIAKNYMYYMEYRFSFNGEPIRPRHIQLPYVEDGGVLYISGSRHIISPVISDRVISVPDTNIFVRLLKAKNLYHRETYHFSTNQIGGRLESAQVVWSMIYNGKKETSNSRSRVKANTTIAHYLFCKYGFSETMVKFAGCIPIVGDDDITEENYPSDKWIICESSGIRIKSMGSYKKSPIRIAIRKDEYKPIVKSLIAGFFYVIDRFSTRSSHVEIEQPSMWRILLGIILYGPDHSEGKLLSEINEHISSIDKYVDGIVQEQLRRIGYDCSDIYELFALILSKFDEWMLESDIKGNSKYGKELSVLYFVCSDISRSIFGLYFELRSSKRKDLNKDKIEKLMAKHLRPGAIYGLNKTHGEVSTGGYSGDNKALRTTLILVPQSETSKRGKSKGHQSTSDPSTLFDASMAEVNVITAMSKAAPSGVSRVSPYLAVDEAGLIIRNPDLVDLIDWTQTVISRPSSGGGFMED